MIPAAARLATPAPVAAPDEPHVLLVIGDRAARFAIADQMLEAGLRVSVAPSFGLVEVLRQRSADFDLLVTAQSFSEMALFGLPQLARSVQPDLPILVVEADTACGRGVVEAARQAIGRWPIRERAVRQYH